MRAQNTLRDWSRSEQVALSNFALTAGWLPKFFDPSSNYYSVAVAREPEQAEIAAATPNSASFLMGLAVRRDCARLPAADVERPLKQLADQVAQMDEQIRGASPSLLLPWKSFGHLPLFSTSFVAEYLPLCLTPSGAGASLSYALVMRRLLLEFASPPGARGERSPPHAFVVSHASRAITAWRKVAPRALFDLIKDADALWNALESEREDFRGVVEWSSFENWWRVTMAQTTSDVFTDRTMDDVAETALANLRGLARQAVMTEISNQQRATSTIPDAASLAFGLLTLSEGDVSRHDELIVQGLDVLQGMQAYGLFPFGRPFFSDTRGVSLLVTSVEIAAATLEVAMNPRLQLSEELLDRVEDATGEVQKRLISDHNEIDGVSGWCSDRAAIEDRVESWVTAHAMAFFASRVRFLRLRKRLFVFSKFSIESYESVKPTWDKLPDPDKGHCTTSLKTKIEKPDNSTFLLYGPPGTSKTTVAKAAATMANNCRSIMMLSPSDFVQDSLERIEYRSREVFEQLMNVDNVVVIFDEIDTLFRDRTTLRNKAPGSILEFVVPALLPKLQDFRNYALRRNVTIFFLTNFVELIDPAISRAGRIDGQVIVLPYSVEARGNVVRALYAENAGVEGDNLEEMLKAFERLPCTLVYQDINALVLDVVANGFNLEDFERKAAGRGISPEVYVPEDRPRALREFCLFAARAFSIPLPREGLDDPDAQATFLRVLAARDLPSDWRRVVGAWQK